MQKLGDTYIQFWNKIGRILRLTY